MPAAVCTGCRAKYRAPDELAGKTLKCKKCGAPVKVPAAAPEPSNPDDFDGSALASALDSMQPKQAPTPARVPAREPQDDFTALLNQIDAEQDAGPTAAASSGAWGGTKKKKKPKKAKPPKGQAAAPAGEINPFTSGAAVVPRQAPTSPERFGRDDTSMMLFMIAGLITILLTIYQLFMAYKGYDDAVAAEIARYESMGMTVDRSKVPGFPLGQTLLGFVLGLAVFFCIAVPYNMIGVLITGKIMKFQMVGSKYVNTLGWLSVPTVVASVGFLLDGQRGGGIAYLVGFVLTIPAFGFLHGLRMVETIVGYLITVVLWAVPVIGLIVLALSLVAAREAANNFAANNNAPPPAVATPHTPTTGSSSSGSTRPSGSTTQESIDDTEPPVKLSPYEKAMVDVRSTSTFSARRGLTSLLAMDLDEAQLQEAKAGVKGILDREPPTGSLYTEALQAGITWDIEGLDAYLLETAKNGSNTAEKLATQTLIDRKDVRVLPILLSHLSMKPEYTAIIESFGKDAGPAVLEKLQNETSLFRKRDLLPLLEKVGTEQAVPTLRTLATDRDQQVAAAARKAWQTIAPDTYEPVQVAMADFEARNLSMALDALKDAEVDPQLVPVVNEKLLDYATSFRSDQEFDALAEAWQPWVDGVSKAKLTAYLNDERSGMTERRAALQLLSRWQDEDALDNIQKWIIKEPDLTTEALSRYGEKAIVPMARLLSNRNEDIVAVACRVLGNVGGARDIARLQGVTRRTSNQPKAASAAEIAIAQIEAREAQNATSP